MTKKRWAICGYVGVLAVGVLYFSSIGRSRAAAVPDSVVATVEGLKWSSWGAMSAMSVNGLAADIAKNQAAVNDLLTYAGSSEENRSALAERLLGDLGHFAQQFAPGTAIAPEVLEKRTWEKGEEPEYGLTIDAYLLLEIAKEAESLDFTRQALLAVWNAYQANAYYWESRAVYLLPGETDEMERARGRREHGGYLSTQGAELAWCCEAFLVRAYFGDAFASWPDAAKKVIADYWEWREATLLERFEAGWLPTSYEHRTMDYVRRLAEALPVE